jgi:DHA1 family inner membrane transport protein
LQTSQISNRAGPNSEAGTGKPVPSALLRFRPPAEYSLRTDGRVVADATDVFLSQVARRADKPVFPHSSIGVSVAYFGNDAINRVNLHSSIQAFAQGAGGVFFLVFLLKAGVSIPLTLVAQAAIVAGRFLIRPALLPLARRWGLKRMLLIGTAALAAQYPLLAEVHGPGAMLAFLCVVASAAEVFYWLSFNATFSTLGDSEHRGHQISARAALVAISGIAAPLIGAFTLVTLGARTAFAIVAGIQLLATLPLLSLPNIPIKARTEGAFRAARPGIAFSAIDGWFDTFFILLWQIALFVALGESFARYGGAMALAGLVGAACGLVLGRHVDRGHARRAVLIAYGVLTTVASLRATSLGSPAFATIANALGTLAMILISPTIGVISNLAKASPCPFRFHMGTEAGWDVGCFAACLTSAVLIGMGLPLAVVILLALPGAGASAFVLWRLYPPRRRAPQTTQAGANNFTRKN